MKTYALPTLSDREWRTISAVIPRNAAGPRPRYDRQIISALCYSRAARCSLESLPPGYPLPASVRTRTKRWARAGALPKILTAAKPAIERMHANYWGRLSDLSPWGSDWQFNRKATDRAFANLPRLTHRR